jgi:hypothetical protein
LPEHRNVIYKRGHQIEPKGFYVIEISSAMQSLFIAAYSAVGPESFVLHFKDEEARSTLHKFGTDFNIMAMCLSFRNDRLVLRHPKNLFSQRNQSTPIDDYEATNIQIDHKKNSFATDRK